MALPPEAVCGGQMELMGAVGAVGGAHCFCRAEREPSPEQLGWRQVSFAALPIVGAGC